MEVKDAFGLVLKQVRVEYPLSQEKLASLSNLDRTYISLMERGKRNPSLETIFALALALEVLPSELITKTEKFLNQ